jgi:hypothetical protein
VSVKKRRVRPLAAKEIDRVRRQLERDVGRTTQPSWNPDPDDVQRSVVRLVLTLVEFLRKVMERQAIRRMEEGTLTEDEVEAVGLALMKLEETILDLSRRFGIKPEELNLELGPLGRLM